MDHPLRRAADVAVRECLAVKPREQVLIVSDADRERIGSALWMSALAVGADASLCLVRARLQHGEEPPPAIAAAMKHSDVVFAPTSWSISHTMARKEACQEGARIATLPGITDDIMARAVATDYGAMALITESLAQQLTDGETVRLITPAGTDLSLDITGRTGLADTGILTTPGSFGNLPAGEAFIAPVEGSARGKVVIDGSMAGIGIIDLPIEITLEKGLVVDIRGGEAARKLKGMLEPLGEPARNLAELGLGTNSAAKLTGNVLEDEKVKGTAHIAFGSNATFGGKVHVPLHLDGILHRPTLMVDGRAVLRDGTIVD